MELGFTLTFIKASFGIFLKLDPIGHNLRSGNLTRLPFCFETISQILLSEGLKKTPNT